MAGGHNQRLVARQELQVALDQPILQPVLADLPGFPVGGQLIWVEGDVEIEVVVDHHLEGFAFEATPLVLVDGLSLDVALGAKAVGVDSPGGDEFLQELRGQYPVPLFRDIAEGVFEGEFRVRRAELEIPFGCSADPFYKGLFIRQFGEDRCQFDRHGPGDLSIGHHRSASFLGNREICWRQYAKILPAKKDKL